MLTISFCVHQIESRPCFSLASCLIFCSSGMLSAQQNISKDCTCCGASNNGCSAQHRKIIYYILAQGLHMLRCIQQRLFSTTQKGYILHTGRRNPKPIHQFMMQRSVSWLAVEYPAYTVLILYYSKDAFY